MKPFQTVGIVANPGKSGAVAVTERLIRLLSKQGVTAYVDPELPVSRDALTCRIADMADHDMVLVLGGDGTLLHAVRELDGKPVPVLGINLGSLGFLTEVSSGDIDGAVEAIVAGRYQVIERPLLKATINDGAGNRMQEIVALNDIVVDEGSHTRRAVKLQLHLNNQEIGHFVGDGIIVATPAGSTAYNLSAGGPILSPGFGAFVLTAICPHTMSFRPIVYPENQTVLAQDVRAGLQVKVTADGQIYAPVPEGGSVSISKDTGRSAHFVTLGMQTYFEMLRSKLKMGG